MLAVLLIALVSVLVPLSLCVVPSFGRYTVFPLLSKLIHRFTAAYVLPTLQVELLFGSFDVRGRAREIRETLRGITIALLQVQLQPEFLKSLAFEKKGTGPVRLRDVTLREVSVHVGSIGSAWRVVIDVNNVDVHAHMVNPNEEALLEVKDAVTMKVGEAFGWVGRFVGEKAKDDQHAQVAQMPESDRKFGLKDRIMQLVVARIGIQVRDVNVVVDAPSLQPARKEDTRIRIGIKELEVLSSILHEEQEKALELIQTDIDIREEHKIRIDEFAITTGKAVEEWKKTPENENEKKEIALLRVPSLELTLEVPPMARVLGLVPNYAPIPLEKRVARVQLLLPSSNRVTLEKDALVRVLQDALVPYSDYQVALKTIKDVEIEYVVRNPASAEEITFYVETFKKVETDTKLAAPEKEKLQVRLLEVEGKLSLNDIIKLRMKSLGLDVYFRGPDCQGLDLEGCIALGNELSAKPGNIMFEKMKIALRLDTFVVDFQENRRQLAEFTLSEFGVNLDQFAIANGEEKLMKDIELTLEQVVFAVMPPVVSTVGPAESPSSKILYADFTHVTPAEGGETRPQQITAAVKQFDSGKQIVKAGLRGIQIVAAAYELEYFLMFVDRLTMGTSQAMAAAKPMPTLPPMEAPSATSTSTPPPSPQQPPVDSLAPFALLGGMLIELDVVMDGCRLMMLPSASFTQTVYADADDEGTIERSGTHGMGKSRVEIPISLRVNVASSKAKEYVELDVTKLGVIARYLDGIAADEDDTEHLLTPTTFSFIHELEADKTNPLINRQKITVTMPDVNVSFSDLSLALVSSCSTTLSTMQTTTPEQAQLRLEMRLKQEEQQKQAEIDAILERIRRMFDEIDKDKNGHIELGELLTLLRNANVAESLLERELEYFVRILFKEIDRDGNGFIEFDELRVYLRDDLLSDGTATTEVAGSGELDGSLNLRGGEYASVDEFEKLSGGVKPINRAQMEEIITQSFFKGRFYDLYEAETHATKSSLNGQRAIDVQKKLVRLLGNYEVSELCWNLLIAPDLPAEERSDWLLQVSTHCGGISEYQNAAKVIARQKKDSIFATAMQEAEKLLLNVTVGPTVKKQLFLTTDFKLGNMRLVLTDPELPLQFSRGLFAIQNVRMSIEMQAGDIGVQGPVDWNAVAISGVSEWTVLFGVRILARSYNDVANAMEDIIEPWELVAALSSSLGENGVAVLVEAEKRFQINVTPGFLKMYRALNEVLASDSGIEAWKEHQEAFRSGLTTRGSQGSDCIIQNSTGFAVIVTVGDERILVKPDERATTQLAFAADGSATLNSLELESWGKTKEATVLPSFGIKNLRLTSDAAPDVTMFVTAYCRLEDPSRQRIVLKSNLYVCNHSSQEYELKYLTLGGETRPAQTSEVIRLGPNERTTLPVSVLMGITEVYARPVRFTEWIIKAKMNDDLVTSAAAIQDVDEQEKAMKATLQQRKGAIVYGVTQEDNSKMIKQLAPGVILRRWHLRSHVEFEVSLLPPFVIRNSLPYKIDYRFVEYKIKASKNVAADFAQVESALKADDDKVPVDVIAGTVSSGHDTEITGISCLSPGYLSVRMVSKHRTEAGDRIKSKWSKPLLMAIHNKIEQFTIKREKVEIETGAAFSLDRLTMPNLPRLIRLSCPYWLVNNTSIDFAIASTEAGAKSNALEAEDVAPSFNYPSMVFLDHDHLSIKPLSMTGKRPEAWSGLGKVAASAYTANPLSDEALKAATWSEPLNSTTINTAGELVCGPNVFGVKIEGLYGSFEQSNALTVSPRFYLQNRLKEKVFIQSFGSSEAVESADQTFRTKRTAQEAKAAQTSIPMGESTPLYHFAPLKKGEVLSQCQKYISLSFSENWGGEAEWSHAVSVSTVGDSYIQLYSPLRQRHIICMASVQVIDMYVYVILSDSSGSPPYRIENYTPFKIDCSQITEKSTLFKGASFESGRTVKNGDWYAFAWSNSLAKEHKMQIRMQHPDGRASEKNYDIDAVGYHESLVFERKAGPDGDMCERVEVIVQTVVDEGTRVLKFVEKELEMLRLENQEAQFEQEFEQRKMIFASSFDIRIAGLGLSLFDALPQEVFFLSVDVIQIQKMPSSLEWIFSVFHSQMDNMLPEAKYAVILNPVDSGFSDKTTGKPPKPLVKMVLDADLAAKIGIYKLLDFQLHSLGLKVDLDYLVNLVKLVEPFLASDAAMLSASIQTLDRVVKRKVPPVPAAELTADGNIRHNLVYFDMLRVGALSVDLEYSITRKDIVSNAGGNNSVIFGLITQVIGLIGSNLSGTPTLSFSEIIIHRCFSTKERLQSQLMQNFIRQAVMQAYRLIASVDIIGDPIGLVEDLGSGVVEFFKMTKDELTGDSQTRGEGVKVLGKTVARTGASTLAKITGSLDKLVGDFAQEEEPASATASEEADTSSGGFKFAKDFGKGITGIFTKPVEGAMKGGVTGLLSGTVQGIAGPGVVLLKQITSTSHNIALGVQSTVVDRSVFGGRRRQTKKVEGNRVVTDFDEQHYRPTRLLLKVVSAQGLLSDDSCDPLCVVRIDEKPVLKTHVLYNTLNPAWQEKTQIGLTGAEQEVQFVVKDTYSGTIEKTIGKCIVSMEELQDDFRPPQFSSSLAQWVKTGVKPSETKKNVSNVVKDKEYTLYVKNEATKGAAAAIGSAGALLGMGSSNRVKMSKDDVQVVVTISSLRDLKITSSSGGGMLGLGNLVSSTPNVSPFVSIHVAKGNQITHTAKMKFTGSGADQKGSAEWNESFTFPVVKKEAEKSPPGILLSLKDKSMLHDVHLGFATLPLAITQPTLKPVEQEVEVRSGKNGTGDVVGYIKMKVEVVGATAGAFALGDPLSPGAADPTSFKLGPDALKAGKIRIACEFE